jgi:4-amino-4-deoxy-L-arabinose transferase-like glycosyltransferase
VSRRTSGSLLLVILATSFALKLRHLDHPAIKPLDEVFHAIVARNFLKHPFTPTLVDHPYLPFNSSDWTSNHIWLHKPPLAMWQIALFDSILGVTTLSLRLPSAILSTLACGLTYLIGVRLLDRPAALIAVALQAFNPVILMLVQGYVFSDHVDISLLFWTELSIYFLLRELCPIAFPIAFFFPSPGTPGEGEGGGPSTVLLSTVPLSRAARGEGLQKPSNMNIVLCGITQAAAFLSKTYPALIVTLLALVAWRKLGPKKIAVLLISTTLTLLPWLLYTAIRFPHEFAHENLQILHHLNENIENWAAPWDQVVFYYYISIFHVFYPAILTSAVIFLYHTWREKRFEQILILAWAVGVITPNLLATSKPMCATLIGWPALWLIFADLISRALRHDPLSLAAWLTSMLLAAIFLTETSIPTGGENWGRTDLPFAFVMREHLWVPAQAAIALVAALSLRKVNLSRNAHRVAVGLSLLATLFLTLSFAIPHKPRGYAVVAFDVTSINAQSPGFPHLSEFSARLPENAAFLVDEHQRLENKVVEFYTDHSCYPATQTNWQSLASQLAQSGALPYLLTPANLNLPVVYVDLDQNRTLYACTPAALAAVSSH